MKKSLALLALAGMLVSCQLPHNGNVAKENIKGLTEATTEVAESRVTIPGFTGDYKPTKSMTGDVDGDGKTDVVIEYKNETGNYVWEARLSTGSSFTHTNYNWTGTGTKNVDLIALKDFNGDGMDDMLLGFNHSSSPVRMWSVRLSTGSSFVYNGSWTESPLAGISYTQLGYDSTYHEYGQFPAPLAGTYKVNKVLTGDVNGDGKEDLILQYNIGQGTGGHAWEARLSTGTSFETIRTLWSYTRTPNVHMTDMADFDGDGKDDLLIQCDYTNGQKLIQVRKSIPNGFDYNGNWTTVSLAGITDTGYDPNHPEFAGKGWAAPLAGTYKVNKVLVGDVNGDSKADIVLQYNMGDGDGGHLWEMRPSTGSSFETVKTMYSYTRSPNVYTKALADANGDGKADLILEHDNNGERRWFARLFTEDSVNGDMFSFSGIWTFTANAPGHIVNFIDMKDANADGKADLFLVYDYKDYRRWQARLSTGSQFVWSGDWSKTYLK